ncbi:WG repeat-containing protein [Streptomyces sp. NPDC012746]|uniref:WG repeat-containing protein n=1 Tax=Streptomyces sp. NPDC012746 TaxID=3364845 RepID=UPI00368ADB94
MTPPSPVPPAPYAVPVEGRAPFGARRALVGGSGELVRPPDLTAVGPFHDGGKGGLIAPAADLAGRWGYLDARGGWIAAPGLEWAGPFDGAGLSRFRSAERWGYADTTGAHVVPARFTDAEPFPHGLAVVRTQDGAGYADPTGRVVIGGGFRAAGPFSPVGLGAVRQAESGQCGYVDRQGRLAVPARFDGARPFGAGGAAAVRIGDRWGLVDTAGEWIVEPSFRLVNPFDENGLAYVVGGEAGALFTGFVDHRGELVITRRGEMDQELRCGLLKVGDGYTRGYVDATGQEAIEDRYAWAEAFCRDGAAVAREDHPERWGVLRTDGSFTPSPHREPLTDDDGWVIGFDDVTGLAPFVTDGGAVAYVGPDGRDVSRVEAARDGSAVTLSDADGRTVWESEPGRTAPGTFKRAWPFLTRDAAQYVDHTPAWEGDPAAVARELLERQAQPFRPCSMIFDDSDDPYDLSALDEDDEDDVRHGAVHVIASVFLAAESLAEYPFLQDWTTERFEEIHEGLRARLTAHYGAPLPDGEAQFLRYGDGERSTTWRAGERLLILQEYVLVGDGDVEMQTWLAAVDARAV